MDLHGNTFHVASVECTFDFAEEIAKEKHELWRRLQDVYFKDEPEIYDIVSNEQKWDEYFEELINDDDAKAMFEDHFHRQMTHRYAGTLNGRTSVKPDTIVRQIALFVGTYHITYYIKSNEIQLPVESKVRCANTMLKIEIRSLNKDLERRDDLCDDLLNEIHRHERKLDIRATENDELILKNRSRLAKINILKEELRRLLNGGDIGGGSKSGSKSSKKQDGETKSEKSSKSKKKTSKDAGKDSSSSSSSSDDEHK